MKEHNKYVKIAGISYLVIILLGILKVGFIDGRLLIPNNINQTINNISNDQLLYNLGVICDLFMYSLVILLSYSLYQILKPVQSALTALALFFRFAEAIIGVMVTIIGGLLPIYLIKREEFLSSIQFHQILTALLEIRTAGLDVILFFVGVGGVLFFMLFFTARMLPSFLAAWGVVTYLSMIVISLLNILLPEKLASFETLLFSLGALFEITIGLWFILKGINSSQPD